MIVQERIGDFIRTYSDQGVYIHGGFPEADYTEATDPASLGRIYTETNISIPDEDIDAEEALRIIVDGA